VKNYRGLQLDTTIYMLRDNKAVVELSYFGLSENTKGGYSDYYMMVWEKILEQKLLSGVARKTQRHISCQCPRTYFQGSDFGLKVLLNATQVR